MEIWEIGPVATGNLAGSAAQGVIRGELTGRPTPPDPDTARRVIELGAKLAHDVPVLHDVSDGGLAVAVAEVCIASGLGAVIESEDPNLLFSEDPHRFIAVFQTGAVELPASLARRVGAMGGDQVVLGTRSVALDLAASTWREAIPRRMG
jgi:phosphoribosylformylglycinamidine synthase